MTVAYYVNYRRQGDTTWSRWPPDGSTINTLSTVVGQNPPGPALASSQAYDFEVIATNAFGSTTSSVATSSTTSGVAFQSIALNPASPTFTAGFTGSIATVVVTMTSGSFSGSLTVTTGNANFSIVNGQVQVTNANLAAGPQSFTIQATQASATNSPYSQGFTVQVGAALAESAEATVVKTTGQTIIASRTNRVASNGPFNYWQLTSGAQIQLSTDGTNYSVQSATSGVSALLYHKDTLFQLNSAGNWWYWNTSTSDALAGTAGYVFYNLAGPVTLSTSSYTANAAAGTFTATISCPMSSNAVPDSFPGNWGGTYTLDSASAATFQITGSTLTNKVTLSAASYAPTITAALNITGSDSTVYSVGHAISTGMSITQAGTVTLIQIPVGLHTGTGLADNRSGWSSPNAHYVGFNNVMGLTAVGRHAMMIGTAVGGGTTQYGGAAPNSWPSTGGDAQSWLNNGFPTDGSVAPFLHWSFSDGLTDNNYSLYSNAQIRSNTTYNGSSGQTVEFYIRRVLSGWKTNLPGLKTVYVRPEWEWNIGGPGNGIYNVGSAGNMPNFVEAWRGFANVCHDWGNSQTPKVAVKLCWSASVFNAITSESYGLPVIQQFPAPDGNARPGSDGTTQRYVDIMAPDFYYDPNFDPRVGHDGLPTDGTFSRTTNQRWTVNALVDLALFYNISMGFSETNDGLNQTQLAWQNMLPNIMVPWLNTMNTSSYRSVGGLSGPVRWEYMCFFDINVGGAVCFSAPASGDLAILGQAYGSLGPSATFGSCAQALTIP